MQVQDVDPAASAMLDILVELGHLDDVALAQVNDRLLDIDTPDGRIRLEDVRRLAAEVIFDRADQIDPEFMHVVEQDWSLLFA